jgi:MoaD family protein
MAKILIRFLAHAKEAMNKESTELSISDGETIEQVLDSLTERFGDPLQKVFFKKDGSISENLVIFVNGRNVLTEKSLKTLVKNGDQVLIFTPIAGG